MKKFPGKLALQQRVLPDYRAPFFDLLASACKGGMSLFTGLPRPGEGITTPNELRGVKYELGENLDFFSDAFYLCYQRGLLDSTLVMVTTEFGRTPKINGNAGRDHWPKVFSIVMAGGGIKRGSVFGSSDSTASEPQDDPLSVDDWSTTIYTLLGVDPKKQLLAPGSRPIRVVDGGDVKKELLA